MEDLVELTAFVAVAGTLHLGRAAAEVGAPRTTLAGRLRRLEARLGMVLIDRSHRCRIALTQEGTALLPAARRAVDALGAFTSEAGSVRAGRQGVVRVGLVTGRPDDRVDRLVDTLRSVDAGWRIEVVKTDRVSAVRSLAIGGLDCVIADRYLGSTARPGVVDRRPDRHEPRTGVRIDVGTGRGLRVVWRRRWAAPARTDPSSGSPARAVPRHAAALEAMALQMGQASYDARYPGQARRRWAAVSRGAWWHRELRLRRGEERRLGVAVAAARGSARERRRALRRLWKDYVRGDPETCAFVDEARGAGIDVGLGLDPTRPPRGVGRASGT